MNEEREQEKTIEWYKAQAKETSDLKRLTFHLWKNDEDELCGDEYFPDKVARKYRQLEDEKQRLQKQVEELEKKLVLSESQNHCKMCGSILDGYVPPGSEEE